MNLEQRTQSFAKLGKLLVQASKNEISSEFPDISKKLIALIENTHIENPWFIKEYVQHTFNQIGNSLSEKQLQAWTNLYSAEDLNNETTQTIAVVMAGNIPLVGFHDFLSVLISGHKILIKQSSKDPLIFEISNILCEIDSDFIPYINFAKDKLENFDAIIATGSNNTKRYFEYYFSKYPSIIRGHRNSVAVITGNESEDDLKKLANDVFLYFGMGCRNISKIYIPLDYPVKKLIEAFLGYEDILLNHHKYFNNYEYYKSIYLINREVFLDSGFFIMKQDPQLSPPLSVVYWEEYSSKKSLLNTLNETKNNVQCIVCEDETISTIPFGEAQNPSWNDYADGIDVVSFLLAVKKRQ